MSRMFKTIDQTWNVFVGCLFDCTYCNARKAAKTRFKHLDRYKNGFSPHLVKKELARKFQPGRFIFVAYMGDISFAAVEDIVLIRSRMLKFPETKFLLQSKDPECFDQWGIPFPSNVYLGTTIESDHYYPVSRAPTPYNRALALIKHPHPNKFLSIEPVMDFNVDTLTTWVDFLRPAIIEVGADNYHNHLPEPSPEKLERLLANLRDICPRVIEKDGLERLKRSN